MTMNSLILVISLVAVLACFILVLRTTHKRVGRILGGTTEEKARQELVKLCFGDEEAAERLRQREIKRSPYISSREAYKRAARRYRRHNQ
jgi:hypothetical protein